MKKLLLIAVAVMCSMTAMAQVEYFKGGLEAAKERAKAENKPIFIMASASWCGPCILTESKILSTKEAGDFFNENVIFLKYILDKSKADNIEKVYEVTEYPTFLVLDSNGDVMMRYAGGGDDVKGFIAKAKEAINPDNSLPARERKFEIDPSYGNDYYIFLMRRGEESKANAVLKSAFERRKVKDNFSDQSLDIYKWEIKSIDDYILTYMLDEKNIPAIIEEIGEDKFYNFVNDRGIAVLDAALTPMVFNLDEFNKVYDFVSSQPLLKNNRYYKFIKKNMKYILARNTDKIFPKMFKVLEVCSTSERSAMMKIPRLSAREDHERNKPMLVRLLQTAAKYEKDAKMKASYEMTLSYFER